MPQYSVPGLPQLYGRRGHGILHGAHPSYGSNPLAHSSAPGGTAWQECWAAAGEDHYLVGISMGFPNNLGASYVLVMQFALGAAGAEAEKGTLAFTNLYHAVPYYEPFGAPIFVPQGTRLSMRAYNNWSSSTFYYNVHYVNVKELDR